MRYNLGMDIGRISHTLAKSVHGLLHLVADSLVTGTESSSIERPLSEGSEMVGHYNYRTRTLDCGSDPIGWYDDNVS